MIELLEIKQVAYSHNQKINHVDQVDETITPGTITTIIGPNGCGKSTLLGVLSNSYQPQSGQVILDGKDLTTYRGKQLAQKLGVVHQHNTAPSDMTVERLTGYGRIPHQSLFSKDDAADKEAIHWALEKTNLLDKRQVTIDALSGGERQRVWIAMALAQRTPYLFLDEPTTYLDMYYQYEILELVKQLNEEEQLTIVMVLHDLNQAIRYSDHIIAMKSGKVLAKGNPKAVMSAELIRQIYGIDVLVKIDEQMGMYTIPIGI